MGRVDNVILDLERFEGLAEWCSNNNISLVFVGPETALANGVADYLSYHNINCFGPVKGAARLETDKKWAKEFMDIYGIMTPQWRSFTNPLEAKRFVRNGLLRNPFVIKATGLAAGKGVIVTSSTEEAIQAIDEICSEKFGSAADTIIVEERLYGREASVLAFCDGKTVSLMPIFQDYKRLLDDDCGPNTGGMGVHGPLSTIDEESVKNNILLPIIDAMNLEKRTYIGILYAGIMITDQGQIYTLEFNCRFGDPEAQVILLLLQSDLYKVAMACCDGNLNEQNVSWKQEVYCVGVVLATEGYPDIQQNGLRISGVDKVDDLTKNGNVIAFHGKTALDKTGTLTTAGGRILTVVGCEKSLLEAMTSAYYACTKVNFRGIRYRRDIALRAVSRQILTNTKSAYKMAGVNVVEADRYINKMKDMIERQFSPDVISEIDSYASIFTLDMSKYKCPYLVSSTDGVGTKLKIAQACNKHEGIGKDLVAMSVNDVLCQGAQPLFFLDYFASGKLLPSVMDQVLQGIMLACRESGCTLVGGETAEMPGVYQAQDYDVAGFAVGIVERDEMLPRTNEIVNNDMLIALPSSGVHSNGLSLVRKVVEQSGYSYKDVAPFGNGVSTIGDEILKPTNIYVNTIMPLIKQSKVKAMAHITGGGIKRNLQRILPRGSIAVLDAKTWKIPKIFAWLAAAGQIGVEEMLGTFNCGLGAILIIDAHDIKEVLDATGGFICGHINLPQYDIGHRARNFIMRNFEEVMAELMAPYVNIMMERRLTLYPKKRVAVFISGVGTNLKSLIDAAKDFTTNAQIVVVLSNVPNAEGLKIAAVNGISTETLSNVAFGTVDECSVLNVLMKRYNIDIVCLAGFMRVLSEKFVNNWRGKILNIHPSLLPSFKGLHAQKKALDAGVRVTGCTVHFVEPSVDSGAIIEQESVPIVDNDTVYSLTERIKQKEHIIYPRALKLLAKGKIRLNLETSKVERFDSKE